MAKFSLKIKGKEVGQASVYAKPHDMSGNTVSAKNAGQYMTDPNVMKANEMTPGGMPVPRVSMGDPARETVKTTGIKIRGTGCATKGVMARGPMA
jgi:hypothetical protein